MPIKIEVWSGRNWNETWQKHNCGEILAYLDREEIKIPCKWYMAWAKEIFPLARAAGGW